MTATPLSPEDAIHAIDAIASYFEVFAGPDRDLVLLAEILSLVTHYNPGDDDAHRRTGLAAIRVSQLLLWNAVADLGDDPELDRALDALRSYLDKP